MQIEYDFTLLHSSILQQYFFIYLFSYCRHRMKAKYSPVQVLSRFRSQSEPKDLGDVGIKEEPPTCNKETRVTKNLYTKNSTRNKNKGQSLRRHQYHVPIYHPSQLLQRIRSKSEPKDTDKIKTENGTYDEKDVDTTELDNSVFYQVVDEDAKDLQVEEVDDGFLMVCPPESKEKESLMEDKLALIRSMSDPIELVPTAPPPSPDCKLKNNEKSEESTVVSKNEVNYKKKQESNKSHLTNGDEKVKKNPPRYNPDLELAKIHLKRLEMVNRELNRRNPGSSSGSPVMERKRKKEKKRRHHHRERARAQSEPPELESVKTTKHAHHHRSHRKHRRKGQVTQTSNDSDDSMNAKRTNICKVHNADLNRTVIRGDNKCTCKKTDTLGENRENYVNKVVSLWNEHNESSGGDGDIVTFKERLLALSSEKLSRQLSEDFPLNQPIDSDTWVCILSLFLHVRCIVT